MGVCRVEQAGIGARLRFSPQTTLTSVCLHFNWKHIEISSSTRAFVSYSSAHSATLTIQLQSKSNEFHARENSVSSFQPATNRLQKMSLFKNRSLSKTLSKVSVFGENETSYSLFTRGRKAKTHKNRTQERSLEGGAPKLVKKPKIGTTIQSNHSLRTPPVSGHLP